MIDFLDFLFGCFIAWWFAIVPFSIVILPVMKQGEKK